MNEWVSELTIKTAKEILISSMAQLLPVLLYWAEVNWTQISGVSDQVQAELS